MSMDAQIVTPEVTFRRYHARIIKSAVMQLKDDGLLGWEIDELVDTVSMHAAALASTRS